MKLFKKELDVIKMISESFDDLIIKVKQNGRIGQENIRCVLITPNNNPECIYIIVDNKYVIINPNDVDSWEVVKIDDFINNGIA